MCNPRARSCPHSAQKNKAGKQPGANGGNIRAAASQRPASCAQSGGLQLQVAPSGGYRRAAANEIGVSGESQALQISLTQERIAGPKCMLLTLLTVTQQGVLQLAISIIRVALAVDATDGPRRRIRCLRLQRRRRCRLLQFVSRLSPKGTVGSLKDYLHMHPPGLAGLFESNR